MITCMDLIKRYKVKAKKSFGQNFIIDDNTVNKIANLSLGHNKTIIEIGPGIGSLTKELSKIAKRVIAFEIDDRLISILEDVFKDSNVEIIHKDFLEVDFKDFVDKLNEEIVVCANLPYYITSPILFKIIESQADIKYLTFMVQKEVADRLYASANSKNYNALSVIIQYLYDVTIPLRVSKNIFDPKPKVDSSIIHLVKKEKLEDIDTGKFFDFVKAAFKQRRKTLYNNLKVYFDDKNITDDFFKVSGINPNVRAQEISLKDFIKLYKIGENLYER